MKNFLRRLAKLASPSHRRRYFERRRLEALPRYQPGITSLLGQPIRFADAASFLSAAAEIFDRQIYRFSADNPAPRIIDGGANIGLATLYFKTLHPAARITAFEPDPEIAALLRKNVAPWHPEGVEIVEKALGTGAGRLQFSVEGADAGRLGTIPGRSRRIEVETVALSDYLDQRIDFLKLDIEGAETAVLEAAAPRLGNVEKIFVEYHSFAGEPQSLPQLLTLLRKAGFRLHLHPSLTSPSPLHHLTTITGMDLLVNIFGWRE